MIITGSLLIVCLMLLLGVSVYVAFGSVLIFIAIVGDQSISGICQPGQRESGLWFYWRFRFS